nr:phosphomethylpyrimidine synthase ThiC [Thermoguttaceae bacterium]
ARHRPHAQDRDDEMSRARYNFDWPRQFELSLDPETAKKMHEESINHSASHHEYCSMCGPKFCSIRNSQAAIKDIGK